jgi:hypothetical protein
LRAAVNFANLPIKIGRGPIFRGNTREDIAKIDQTPGPGTRTERKLKVSRNVITSLQILILVKSESQQKAADRHRDELGYKEQNLREFRKIDFGSVIVEEYRFTSR